MPFLICHPETKVTYELSDVAYFVSEYQDKGFEIVSPAPTGYTVPELPKPEPEPEPKVTNAASVKRTTHANPNTGDGNA